MTGVTADDTAFRDTRLKIKLLTQFDFRIRDRIIGIID